MCGPENTNRPRGGALVSLNSPTNSPSRISGDLAFHTPGSPSSSSATHARLTPSEECSIHNFSDLHVIIHSSGDLTRNASECGLFRQFSLQTPSPTSNDFVESQLQGPLSLEVGGDGIIGRRVSVFSRLATGQNKIVAEGIVGFNFMSQELSDESSCPPSPSSSL